MVARQFGVQHAPHLTRQLLQNTSASVDHGGGASIGGSQHGTCQLHGSHAANLAVLIDRPVADVRRILHLNEHIASLDAPLEIDPNHTIADAIAGMKAEIDRGGAMLQDSDREFHLAIAQAAGNAVLAETIEGRAVTTTLPGLPQGVAEGDALAQGMAQKAEAAGFNDKMLKRQIALINSMTRKERANPDMLQASRKLLADKSKRLSFALSFSLMALFVLLAGLSASIFRAAIVSGLSMVTQFYGRSMRPELLISMAATITVWINPLYIWGDPSWYLSFLAFYGVMVVGPLLQARLPTRLENSVIVGVFLESLSAEIMTLPFVLAMFGQMSLVNLPANVLVVALVPLAMLLSTIAGLLGMFAPMMAGWLSWPAAWLLTYMLDTAHLLSGIPGIFRQNVWLSAAQMWGVYGLIGCMTWLLSRKSAKITPYERTQQMVNH